MSAGNSFRLEGGPASAPVEAVYATVDPKVVDEYNARLLRHLQANPVTPGADSYGRRYQEAVTEPDTTGAYPKLVGGQVWMLPYDGGPSVPKTEVRAPAKKEAVERPAYDWNAPRTYTSRRERQSNSSGLSRMISRDY